MHLRNCLGLISLACAEFEAPEGCSIVIACKYGDQIRFSKIGSDTDCCYRVMQTAV